MSLSRGLTSPAPLPPPRQREKNKDVSMARSPEQLRQIANAEKCLGDFVPFSSEIAPGVVVAERVDVFRSKDGPELRLPVVGVFETKGDLIKVWRDYFDSAPFAAT